MHTDGIHGARISANHDLENLEEKVALLSLESQDVSVRDAQSAMEALLLKYPDLKGKSADTLVEMYKFETAFDPDRGDACLKLARLMGSKIAQELFREIDFQTSKPAAVARTSASSTTNVEDPQVALTKAKVAYEAKDYQAAYDYFSLAIRKARTCETSIQGEAYFYIFILLREAKVKWPIHNRPQEYYLKQAAEYEFPEAALKFAIYYEGRSPAEEQRYLKIAANKGQGAIKASAMYKLARIAYRGNDFTEAGKYFKSLADGDSEYRQKAAREYVSMTKDLDEAAKYILRSAADPLNPDAYTYFEYAKLPRAE